MTERVYLTTSETADITRMKPQTLRVWRWRGDGPPFKKIGSRVFYDRSEVFAWIDQQSCNSTSTGKSEQVLKTSSEAN